MTMRTEEIERSYLVMGAPRAGSSLLCRLLARVGSAGVPEEYFWAGTKSELMARWNVTDEGEYRARVAAEGTTSNGVFAAKVMWTYLDDAVNLITGDESPSGCGQHAALRTVLPHIRYVWIYRDDVVAQGVSWAKAERSGSWQAGDPSDAPAPRLHFDLTAVHNLVWLSARFNAFAVRWFASQNLRPITVRYEDLVADTAAAVTTVCDELDVPVARDVDLAPPPTRQSDATNEAWIARYRAEARSLPAGLPLLADPLPREREWPAGAPPRHRVTSPRAGG